MKDRDIRDAQILEMLVPNPARDVTGIVEKLSMQDWEYLLERGQAHRFLPMLHWTLAQAGALTQVPDTVQQELNQSKMRHTFRALNAQRELLQLHRLLKKADIGHVFLKGAYLAQFVYPHPALRPVRDIDVAVNAADIEHAYDVLKSAGYAPMADAPGMVAAHLDQAKHLPGLVTPSRKLIVEMHVRIDFPGGVLGGLDAFRHVIRRKLADEELPFMDPVDLMIHLCVHAVNFHCFNNGPLIVSDVGFLLKTAEFDVDELFCRGEELGVTKSVCLALAFADLCWGLQCEDLERHIKSVPVDLLRAARHLSLSPDGNRGVAGLVAELRDQPNLARSAKTAFEKVFPGKDKLALEFGVPRSSWQLGGFVVHRMSRLAASFLSKLLRVGPRGILREDVKHALAIKKWAQ